MSGPAAVRPPAVAGSFYSASASGLERAVRGHLAAATVGLPPALLGSLRGLIVPHAGHVYSGPVAGSAYRLLAEPATPAFDRVVLLGLSHFVPVPGMAASTADSWETPLGRVGLDRPGAQQLVERFPDWVRFDDDAHAREHSLEVQLPFLQVVLNRPWRLLPLAVGHLAADRVAQVAVAALAGGAGDGARTLLLVSSDLSHYLPYAAAARTDSMTVTAIEELRIDRIGDADACGAYAVRGALELARRQHWTASCLDLRSSGDTAGTRDRVVGYAAVALVGPPVGAVAGDDAGAGVRPDDLAGLPGLARRTIESALREGRRGPAPTSPAPAGPLPSAWQEPGAAFVTLRDRETGELLGCVGSMEPTRALAADVAQHALDAAFADRRFAPLTAQQAQRMTVEVSVLGPLVPFAAADYSELVRSLPVGAGLLMEAGPYRATFLPAVWGQVPVPAAFVSALWAKAGLPPGAWPPGLRLWTYSAVEVGE